ncbi:MAG: ATP-binding protein [Deltaproteobacteria bacterium]|jgi:hypothetical protein|nr:ATP-binding protein [Deltaproteobacteria bacterium]
MKNIDSSNQVFDIVIEDNLIYADKTKHVCELLKSGKAYFLSRPRRFGKSLLLSTIAALFKGPSDPEHNPQGLFKGLWISGEDANYDFNDTYPVIYISMSTANYSPEIVIGDIQNKLRVIANSYGIALNDGSPQAMLTSLILDLKGQYGKNVVLLIDEYDDPISSVIGNPDLAEKNSYVLRGFYSILKENQPNLRFVMLTGVTRYELLWQSGVLNHLFDFTMSEEYADICGFTYDEFDNCFADRFEITLKKFKEKGILDQNCGIAEFREAIFEKYDGYSWDGKTRVLNPFSLLNAFKNKNLKNYWATLEPSKKFLKAIMSKNPLSFTADKLRDLSQKSVDSASIVGSLTPVPSLFQTGYLTIDKITTVGKDFYYTFKIPNAEINPAYWDEFSDSLFDFLDTDRTVLDNNFIKAVVAEDSNKLSIFIDSFFGSIPASLHIPKESYYHSVIYGYLNGLTNLTALSEIPGADGTPDILCVIDKDLYVVVELKFKDNPETNPALDSLKTKAALKRLAISALKAIDEKNYLRPYLAKAKKMLKLGLGVYGRGRAMAILENEERAKERLKPIAKRSRGHHSNKSSTNARAKK